MQCNFFHTIENDITVVRIQIQEKCILTDKTLTDYSCKNNGLGSVLLCLTPPSTTFQLNPGDKSPTHSTYTYRVCFRLLDGF